MVPPCLELGRSQRDHKERHLGVLHAAEFRALAAIDAWPIRFDTNSVSLAGYHVHLARQLRYPEGMDDITRPEVQLNRHASGNDQIVRGRKLARRRIRPVAGLPPPLLPGNVDCAR